MKHSSIKFFLLLVLGFIISSCHKNKPNTIPIPRFDSTAYHDSVAHAQHIHDSIQHYNDSLVHYQDSLRIADSTFRYYFNRIRGTYTWSDTNYVYPAVGLPWIFPHSDTTLTIDYANIDTTHLSVKIGDEVFPAQYLQVNIYATAVVFSSHSPPDVSFLLTYVFSTDSIRFQQLRSIGALSNSVYYYQTKK